MFIADLASRLASRMQLTADGYKVHINAVENAFAGDVDFVLVEKIYGIPPEGARGYSPAECSGVKKKPIIGNPDQKHVSTSFVERQNLTMRMSMRSAGLLATPLWYKLGLKAPGCCVLFRCAASWRAPRPLRITAVVRTVTAMANAADIPYAPQPQQASLLCWAAATQIIVEVLNQTVDQPTLAAYAWLPATGTPAQMQAFHDKVTACHLDIAQFCNRSYLPIIDELGMRCLQSSALPQPYLTEDLITTDIDAGRPIIFGWQYDNDLANGAHFMVIVGYYHTPTTKKLKLHIYDPLPVALGSAQTISFDNYSVVTPIDLHNDMGKPYELMESYYKIQTKAAQAPVLPLPPGGLTVSGATAAGPRLAGPLPETRLIEPRKAIEASRTPALAEVARRESEESTPLSAGYPLPVIALGLEELRSTEPHSLLALLRRDTGTVLYPIETAERVRDSFLMIKRGETWVPGGYANTTVTRLLVEERRKHASSPAQQAEHYLLSVPGLGAFFLARGTGANATLIPVNDDRTLIIGERALQASRAYRADALLSTLAQVALRNHSSHHGEQGGR